MRSANGRCLFGFGESDSDNRAHDALTQALKNPLMDRGKMLADAAHVLVQVAGGPGMTLSEVEILMQELGRHISDHTQILFGTAVDGRMGNRLSVTLISSLAPDGVVAEPPKKTFGARRQLNRHHRPIRGGAADLGTAARRAAGCLEKRQSRNRRKLRSWKRSLQNSPS